MNIIIETLFDTDYGIIIIGAFILLAIIIEWFRKKPKI